jgi:hypothetical protein
LSVTDDMSSLGGARSGRKLEWGPLGRTGLSLAIYRAARFSKDERGQTQQPAVFEFKRPVAHKLLGLGHYVAFANVARMDVAVLTEKTTAALVEGPA